MFDTVIKGGSVIDGTGSAAFTADIGILGGKIVEVGRISAPADKVIDADGLSVTPGWVDIHTHYDCQATWDPVLDPSFSSGVTTTLMGNCGIGVAPAKPEDREWLIELMEGVEDVPAAAIRAGMHWNWNSFAEFIDALDAVPRAFDIGCMVPHGPLRRWALGERAATEKNAKGEDLARMTAQLEEGMVAGAFGLTTSRTAVHRTTKGEKTADFQVKEDEIRALAQVVKRNDGHFQLVPPGILGEDLDGLKADMDMMEGIVADTGVNFHMLMFQVPPAPESYLEQIALIDRMSSKVRATAEFGGRSAGAILGFFGANPFRLTPTFQEVTRLPKSQWLAELAKSEVRSRILSEKNPEGTIAALQDENVHRMYDLGDDTDFEPGPERSFAALAAQAGKPVREFAYDFLLANSVNPRTYSAYTNYNSGNLDAVYDALERPNVVLSASDAGAHVLTVCDGAVNTFMLTHWVRDRKRGPRIPIEKAVHWMSQKPALSIGLTDRGVLAPGMKANINIFDLDDLKINPPEYVNDLPGGSPRLATPVTGYRATMVSGVLTREHDRDTSARPGRVVRRGRH